MAKGGRMKVVWPRGKNLKPLPAGKDLQAIPEVMKRTGVLQLPSTADLRADLTAYKLTETTATDPRMAPAPVTLARLRAVMASMPAMRETKPIEVTPAPIKAAQLDRIWENMQTFGTVVVVTRINPVTSAVEILEVEPLSQKNST